MAPEIPKTNRKITEVMGLFKKHWKKCLLGVSVWLISRWGAKKHREKIILRRYCDEAKGYNNEKTTVTGIPDKIYVFLNPVANNRDARRLFQKYSAPLLHLSGTDIVIVESDYEGQIETLLSYIQSSTAAVIVAGGGGTIMEVVNGLLKRAEKEGLHIPVGVLPLGTKNSFFQQYFGRLSKTSLPARNIGEATMNIIRGNTAPVDVLKLQPEKGNILYAVSSITWGLNQHGDIKDGIFGCLKTLFSHLNTVVRRWPLNFVLNVGYLPDDITSYDATQQWTKSSLKTVGFNVGLGTSSLCLSYLPEQTTSKIDYLKLGLQSCYKNYPGTLQSQETLYSPQLVLTPYSDIQQWYKVDGEHFEAVSLNVTIANNKLQIFSPKHQHQK